MNIAQPNITVPRNTTKNITKNSEKLNFKEENHENSIFSIY